MFLLFASPDRVSLACSCKSSAAYSLLGHSLSQTGRFSVIFTTTMATAYRSMIDQRLTDCSYIARGRRIIFSAHSCIHST